MSDRPIIAPNLNQPLISAGDMSGNITSKVLIIQRLPGVSFDLTWTGTPTGTFAVQVSNSVTLSPDGSVAHAGSWTTLPTASFSGTYPAAAGSASNGFLDVVGTEAYAVRLVYTAGSGSGNLTVLAAAKVL